MKPVIFLGPSLSVETARAQLDAVFLPPVAQGDVYRAGLLKPPVIGIVDGYFSRVPSVWHKEILWAMAQGIHVLGSSSMGALRAAELHVFGMVGIGTVFEMFRDGLLEDDDEVAVAHAGAESGFMATSDAMVNIRVTLAQAQSDGVIDAETAALLISIAKGTYYPERDFLSLITVAESRHEAAELRNLAAWLRDGRIDVKRDDALTLLGAVRELVDSQTEPEPVSYEFQATSYWMDAAADAGTLDLTGDGSESQRLEEVLNEIRLKGPEAVRSLYEAAVARTLAGHYASGLGMKPTNEMWPDLAGPYYRRYGLYETDHPEVRLGEGTLTQDEFREVVEAEMRLEFVKRTASGQVMPQVLAMLRSSSEFNPAFQRARDKRQALDAFGFDGGVDVGLTDADLIAWHFERLAVPVPADIPSYARDLGLRNVEEFMQMLGRERAFVDRGSPSTA